MELSAALGIENLSAKKIGQAFDAEEIKLAERLVASSARTIVEIGQRLNASGSDEDAIAHAQAKARHQMLQAKFAQATAEGGRAFRALRKIQELWSPETTSADAFLKSATGKRLFQLKEEARLIAQLDTPFKVSKAIADFAAESPIDARILPTVVGEHPTVLAISRSLRLESDRSAPATRSATLWTDVDGLRCSASAIAFRSRKMASSVSTWVAPLSRYMSKRSTRSFRLWTGKSRSAKFLTMFQRSRHGRSKGDVAKTAPIRRRRKGMLEILGAALPVVRLPLGSRNDVSRRVP